jgi:putative acyl-CoA dehydrogenase
MAPTHQVVNQAPPLEGHDVLGTDRALREALHRHGGAGQAERLHELGRRAGSPEAIEWGVQANTVLPTLHSHDRFGHRVDEVSFHPAWHRLLEVATEHGLHGAPWRDPDPAAHVVRAVGFIVWSQVEAGHGCPVSMTYAAVPALRADPALAAEWEPRLTARGYEGTLRAPADKPGCLAGMAMTEKQGGSDVRAIATVAAPAPSVGPGVAALTGHKWFCSAPMSDCFLVLARAPGGITCYLVPRVLPDGGRNPFAIQRLKDKLGNRSNASSEIEFDGTLGWRLGEEGRGVATILAMVAATRLDCVLGSSALLRGAVARAAWHAAHRQAFGAPLIAQPAMQEVLADLALESEAATTLGIRLAASLDATAADADHERLLRRLVLPAAKLWVTKRAGAAIGEAMECLGGNGYAEEHGIARLYREAPVNAIWEGAGNIQALDLLRVLRRDPDALEAWRVEVAAAGPALAAHGTATLDEARRVQRADDDAAARAARGLAARLVLVLQAALLTRWAPGPVADSFVATRLDAGGPAFAAAGLVGAGVLGPATARAVVARAMPDER